MSRRSDSSREKFPSVTSIHILALDGIVNVNSLFTVGVFLGLAWNLGDPGNTLVDSDSPRCLASSETAENVVKFHVYSFSSFLFSSLLASALKQGIRRNSEDGDGKRDVVRVNLKVLRSGMLASASGSVFGCVFLTLALADFVQIKLGTLACGSWYAAAAIGPLVTFVPCALVIYIYVVLHAFTR